MIQKMSTLRGENLLKSLSGFLERVSSPLWVLLLLALPLTSFPALAAYFGGSTINPASAIFLVFLILTWLIPYFLKRGKIPTGFSFLSAFLLIAITASLLGNLKGIFPWKEQTVVGRELIAWITLLSGSAFYLVTATIIDSREKLVSTLKWINLGAIGMIAWALLQGYFVLFANSHYPGWMHRVHLFFSLRSLFSGHVSGLAYEPSFLAHQLNMLYLPLWGATYLFVRAPNHKLGRFFTPSALLLLLGGIVLILSGSRIGLIGSVAMIGFLLVWVSQKFLVTTRTRMMKKFTINSPARRQLLVWGFSVLIGFLIFILIILLIMLVLLMASKIDPRLERLFTFDWLSVLPNQVSEIEDFFETLLSPQLANILLFGERSVLWEAAFRVFEQYPVFGVGLGNAGFYFRETIPGFASRLPEIVILMSDGEANFPNPKNLWVRLLAETGIVGFSFYINWLGWLLLKAVGMIKNSDPLYRAMALAGILGLIVIAIDGFSLDTFGLPYYWILFGLLTAAFRLSRLNKSAIEA
jgi:O-antigen ligase